MSGTPDSSLDTLENKLRTLHLSEGQIRNSLTEPILKAILPGSVGVKLKTCIGEKVEAKDGIILYSYKISGRTVEGNGNSFGVSSFLVSNSALLKKPLRHLQYISAIE